MMVSIALLIINLVTFFIYGLDKRKAIKHQWRIPERTLLGLAVFGGSVGAYAGMKVFHHKTRHAKFTVGVPVIIVIQVVAAFLLVKGYLSSGL